MSDPKRYAKGTWWCFNDYKGRASEKKAGCEKKYKQTTFSTVCHGGVVIERSPRMGEFGVQSPIGTYLSL